jgi:hypothetical protein
MPAAPVPRPEPIAANANAQTAPISPRDFKIISIVTIPLFE